MKKLNFLIPSILVTSTIPMVSMVGCDDKNVIPTGIEINGIHIENYEANVPASGEEIPLGYEFTPSSYKGEVEWTCENMDPDKVVATIDSTGKLSVSSENTGKAKITVKAVGYDNVFDSFYLNVNPYITITGGPEEHQIELGRDFTLDAEIIPTGGPVKWEPIGDVVVLESTEKENQCKVTGAKVGHGAIRVASVEEPTTIYVMYIITVIDI